MPEPEPPRDPHRNPDGLTPASPQIGPLSAVLIGISVVVAFLSKLGKEDAILEKLWISAADSRGTGAPLPEILHGEVWRLVTPIFIHYGIAHIVFNMMWLKDLGTMIERRGTTLLLFSLVLITGILSNLAQFAFDGPYFGGMSGVVYGLLGFVWMKAKFEPVSGFFLHKQTVILMIAWFFLCLTGLLGPIANYAHGAGLITGMIWGFLSAKMAPSQRETIFPR